MRMPPPRFHVVVLAVLLAACGGGPFGDGFASRVPADFHPKLTPDQAAEVARQYLDAQEAELAAPELHDEPNIVSTVLSRAADSPTIEPRIPADRAAAAADQLIWLVFASGDFLNLHSYPWSSAGTPHPCGSIIVSDISGEVLGVFPHWDEPSSACPS